ncbi:hypothetical protein [uncultured Thomasclavelia sp.]|uniref:hypothetical protein n=1 Tax=uncultured Thomasclavelia sp. TaxID=3025759 RepID=UPI0025924C88|nr:hypothetical protein [uncultured Thomasclavelia sp.]
MENKKEIAIALFIAIIIVQAVINGLCIDTINDLTLTSNGYKSDRNVCRKQLDSIMRDYERLQNE